jgi:hypothetical protein
VVVQILTDAGQLVNEIDPVFLQKLYRPDSGLLQ